jgi:hypothetical protein
MKEGLNGGAVSGFGEKNVDSGGIFFADRGDRTSATGEG